MDVVWKIRGRLGESGILLWTLLLLLVLSSGAEFEDVQRVGCAFSLSLPGAGEFLRGGAGGRPDGLGKAFTRVPRGAEIVYERLWRRMRKGLDERLRWWSVCVSEGHIVDLGLTTAPSLCQRRNC
jgi:hypothetical protein